MKAIMISIKPKWVAKILNQEKTIEVRKKFPADYVGWVYIYCTKDNHQLVKPKDYDKYLLFTKGAVNYSHEQTLNGKVVARFFCDKVEEINNRYCRGMLIDSCLTNNELNDYLGNYQGYAIHITKLEIFDKPKELSEFQTKIFPHRKGNLFTRTLTKAPQSFMYVEIEGN